MFFENVISCRRRATQKWSIAPLAKAFRLETEFELMLQASSITAIGASIAGKGLLLQEVFDLFDCNHDQHLDVVEVHSMLKWLGFDPRPEDVLDFIEATDASIDDRVSFV
jgi:hypothetical protein